MSEIKQPTPEEIKALLKKHGMTREQAAALVHVSKRVWGNWSLSEEAKDHRPIPLAAYELLLIKLEIHPKYRAKD